MDYAAAKRFSEAASMAKHHEQNIKKAEQLMTNRTTVNPKFFLSCLILILMNQSATAALVYNLVDHGVADHTLTGTISVVDTAPNDGLLESSEVTAWQVIVSGSTFNFDIASTDPTSSLEFLSLSPVLISQSEITIPAVNGGRSGFLYNQGTGLRQFWYFDINSNFTGENEGFVAYQFGPPPSQNPGIGRLITTNAPRVHATLVPEPSAYLLIGFAGMGLFGRRKSKRAKGNGSVQSFRSSPK